MKGLLSTIPDLTIGPWLFAMNLSEQSRMNQMVAKRMEEPKGCLLLSQGMTFQHLQSNKSSMETWLG